MIGFQDFSRLDRLARRLLATTIVVLSLVAATHAELCGDADKSGAVTVTDGVNVLRAAAALPTACDVDLRVCDFDGDGSVTVTDVVNVLRIAAGLTTTSNLPPCPALEDADGDGVPDFADACPFDGSSSIDTDQDGLCDENDSEFVLRWIDLTPRVVYDTDLATTPLTVTAYATGKDVRMQVTYAGMGNAPVSLPMYDDGTNGDRVAADHVFTRTFQRGVPAPATLPLYDGTILGIAVGADGVAAEGNYVGPINPADTTYELGVLSSARVVTIANVSPTIRASRRVLNVVFPSWDEDFSALLHEVYRFYADDFDFAVVFHYGRTTGNGVPYSFGVKNTTSGLGLSSFDATAAYGSSGRLQQIIHMNNDTLASQLLHEIGHRWLAYLHDPGLDLTTRDGVHFGLSTNAGQMGATGLVLHEVGDGQFQVGISGGQMSYSPLEQYLMCVRDPGSLAPSYFHAGGGTLPEVGSIIPRSATVEVTPDVIAAVYGPRLPGFPDCPKDFKVVTIIVSDDFVTTAEHSFAETVMEFYSTSTSGGSVGPEGGVPASFAAATDFGGTLDADLAGSRR